MTAKNSRLIELVRGAVRRIGWLLASERLPLDDRAAPRSGARGGGRRGLRSLLEAEALPWDAPPAVERRGALRRLLTADELEVAAPPEASAHTSFFRQLLAREPLPFEAESARRPGEAIRWLFSAETLDEPQPRDDSQAKK